MSDLIQPLPDGDFLAPALGIWPLPAQLCGAVRPDVPDLPCALAPHWDGQHQDERDEEWETEPLARAKGSSRG